MVRCGVSFPSGPDVIAVHNNTHYCYGVRPQKRGPYTGAPLLYLTSGKVDLISAVVYW